MVTPVAFGAVAAAVGSLELEVLLLASAALFTQAASGNAKTMLRVAPIWRLMKCMLLPRATLEVAKMYASRDQLAWGFANRAGTRERALQIVSLPGSVCCAHLIAGRSEFVTLRMPKRDRT